MAAGALVVSFSLSSIDMLLNMLKPILKHEAPGMP